MMVAASALIQVAAKNAEPTQSYSAVDTSVIPDTGIVLDEKGDAMDSDSGTASAAVEAAPVAPPPPRAPVKSVQPAKPKAVVRKQAPVASAPVARQAEPTAQSAVTPAPKQEARINYDKVPASETAPLMQRLKLVEQLIERHHRAYDYRAFTVKQLQEILKALDEPFDKAFQDGKPSESAAPISVAPPIETDKVPAVIESMATPTSEIPAASAPSEPPVPALEVPEPAKGQNRAGAPAPEI